MGKILLIIVAVLVGVAVYMIYTGHVIPPFPPPIPPPVSTPFIIQSPSNGKFLSYRSGIWNFVADRQSADVVAFTNKMLVDAKTGHLISSKVEQSSSAVHVGPVPKGFSRMIYDDSKLKYIDVGGGMGLSGNAKYQRPFSWPLEGVKDDIWVMVQVG